MKSVLIIVDAEAWQQTAIDALRPAITTDGGSIEVAHSAAPTDILCPLTLNLPEDVEFPGQAVFQACRDVDRLRNRVRQMGYSTGTGAHWLPLVHTVKGALYGEAITTVADGYQQPLHLSDRLRQPLYALGQTLMRQLSAPPAVYLLQFGITADDIVFDRLWPFPAATAIASVGVQLPNLYECHWRCLSHQPIVDLAIAGTVNYATLAETAV
ncbi:MAG: hypothetical protein F6K28_57685 [Microcoleus sp. SIO2G3]|nr:hypothetical protein [Microcoleus sp. SIO2G3]